MRTVGVEEELLLVRLDGDRSRTAPDGQRLADQHPGVEHEFKLEQAEIATQPVTTLDELAAELRQHRRQLIESANQRGIDVAASASSPLPVTPTPTPDERYARMDEQFGIVARHQLTCGMHVHVGIESREHGVAVIDRIRGWLSVITALSGNSPFWSGADTGYASYRTIAWGRWPTSGPTELFGDVAAYDDAVRKLIGTGAALDDGMIYFDARLSTKYPTVEVRVADVCADRDDAVLIAALCRSLVDTAIAGRDSAPPPASTSLLRASAWRAARFGLSDELVDVATGRLHAAADVIDRLVDHVELQLRANDDEAVVRSSLDRLLRGGSGSDRQRAALRRRGAISDVVTDIVERTAR